MKGERNIYAFMRGFGCLLAVACAAFLISCTKDDPGSDPWQVMSDTPVEFNINSSAAVPGTKVTDSGFEGTDFINVFGMLVNDNGSTKFDVPYIGTYTGNSGTPLSFSYSSVTTPSTVRPGNDVYASSYYWPKFEQCDYQSLWFYAYYGVNDTDNEAVTGPVLVTSVDGAPHFTYRTNVGKGAPKEDFLIAQQIAVENDVILNFKRPLAKVTVVVTYSDFIGTLGVDFNMPVASTGTFNYNASEEKEDGACWSDVPAADAHLKLKNSVQINGDSESEYVVGTSYLIPQVIKKFSVLWNYHKEAKDYSTEAEGFLNLQAGKSYTVKLSITKDHVIRVVTGEDSQGNEIQEWITITNENTI